MIPMQFFNALIYLIAILTVRNALFPVSLLSIGEEPDPAKAGPVWDML